jgi:hypothetical protein
MQDFARRAWHSPAAQIRVIQGSSTGRFPPHATDDHGAVVCGNATARALLGLASQISARSAFAMVKPVTWNADIGRSRLLGPATAVTGEHGEAFVLLRVYWSRHVSFGPRP